MTRGALDDPDAAAGQVELVGLHEPGMLGGLAADQRRAGRAAAGGDAADELGHADRVEPPDGDVVEEGQRLRPGAHDVVGAHRHEVDADRVEAADRGGDGRLRADPVGRGDEQRLAIAGRDGEPATEPAQPADDLGPPGRVDVRAHEVDRPLPGRDVDPGAAIGRPRAASAHGVIGAPASGSSSMNLRDGGVVRHGLRVVAVEAGEAELVVGQVERGEHAADRQVAERIGADELADLRLGVGRRR